MCRKIDKLGHARFQSAGTVRQKTEEEHIGNHEPKIDMPNIYLPVNQKTQSDEIENDRGRDETITKPHAGETFRSTVVFGHSLEDDAPPKVSIDLNVPFIPAAVCRVTPTFFFE